MNSFPRHLMRSQPCRVVAWLAWLLLVVSPLQAAPSNSMAGMLHHGHSATVVHDQGHAAPMVADDCCAHPLLPGQPGSGACHCASMCASTLPAMAIARLDRVAPAAPLVTSHPVHAPRGVHTRLLRPPAA
jgi:hypothetical protein